MILTSSPRIGLEELEGHSKTQNQRGRKRNKTDNDACVGLGVEVGGLVGGGTRRCTTWCPTAFECRCRRLDVETNFSSGRTIG